MQVIMRCLDMNTFIALRDIVNVAESVFSESRCDAQGLSIIGCQSILSTRGINGLQCGTCSGSFSHGGFNFHAQGGTVQYVDGFIDGMKFHATNTNMSVSSADGRYRISFAMKNYKLGYPNKEAELHVVDASLPDTVKSTYITTVKGRGISVNSNEIWKILDNLFQNAAATGVSAFQFSKVLITQPAEAQRLITDGLAK